MHTPFTKTFTRGAMNCLRQPSRLGLQEGAIARHQPNNKARQLSNACPGPSVARNVLWITMAFVVAGWTSTVNAQIPFTTVSDSSGEYLFYLHGVGVTSPEVVELSCVNTGYVTFPCSGPNWTSTSLAGILPAGSATSRLTSYSDSAGQHMFFVDASRNINYVHFSGVYPITPVNTPLGLQSFYGLTGFGHGGQEWLFYETADLHIHLVQVSPNGSTESDAPDLTAKYGAPVSESYQLASFSDSAGEHLFYVGANHHIDQLYGFMRPLSVCGRSGCRTIYIHTWVYQDLTHWADPNGLSVLPSPSYLTSFSDSAGEHVVYFGADQKIYQLLGNNGAWTIHPVSQPIGSNNLLLTSFADWFGEHVFYVSSEGHVHQLHFSGSWVDQDLTALAGAAAVSTCVTSQLAAFSDPSNGSEGLFYAAVDGNVHRLFNNYPMSNPLGWSDQNLTSGQQDLCPISN